MAKLIDADNHVICECENLLADQCGCCPYNPNRRYGISQDYNVS